MYDFVAQRSTIKTLFIKVDFVFTSNQNKTIHVTLKILCVRLQFAFVNEEDTTPRRSTAVPELFSRETASVPRLATDTMSSKKRGIKLPAVSHRQSNDCAQLCKIKRTPSSKCIGLSKKMDGI